MRATHSYTMSKIPQEAILVLVHSDMLKRRRKSKGQVNNIYLGSQNKYQNYITK